MQKNSIFISIASYRDTQLEETVVSFLKNAKYPNRLYFSIVSQNYDNLHPNLEHVVNNYGANIFYQKIHPKESFGVGYARHLCQTKLNNSYDYYLQVDSHTQCLMHWDEILINDYLYSHNKYSNFIYSSYPSAWFLEDNLKYFLGVADYPNVIIPKFDSNFITVFKANQKAIDYLDSYGYKSNWFCAGFAFGKTEYFLEVPYDQYMVPFGHIGFGSGEEFSLSVRFFEKGISLITPPGKYFWHLYESNNTKKVINDEIEGLSGEDVNQKVINLEKNGEQRVLDFYNGKIEPLFGIKSKNTVLDWFKASEESPDIIKKAQEYFKDKYVI